MPTGLTDLEITRACAKAMGLDALAIEQSIFDYDPLHDDAQAMALVKRFGLMCCKSPGVTIHDPWVVVVMHDRTVRQLTMSTMDNDLNRAICLCCAVLARGMDGP